LAIWQTNNSSRLLKFINPQESQLIEAATGLHIKFRLGGRNFPPTIYYKIFVHKPIIDMNAFSPRDYTKEGKQMLPLNLFNNLSPITTATEKISNLQYFKDGWYSRMENNPWRPVSDKIWDLRNNPDYNALLPSSNTIRFHHSAIVRRQDLEKRKREKRLSWMKKMYFY
jgi:hypothetical protein